jgi:bifunctional N-acetylglucosamine-1-phosphate-uridyltransferase/glucosamine-1-phosphate-acetyltransferase GlmU-like protein
MIKEWNPGIYIFKTPQVFEILNKIKTNNASKEYYLTDAIGLAQQSDMQIKAIKIANSDEVLGINTTKQLEELES